MRKVIHLLGIQPHEVPLDLRREWRPGEKFGPSEFAAASDQLVFTECFLVEKNSER